MAHETIAITVISLLVLLYRYISQTDVPKIKGLPEVPGVPIFGNLIQLGNNHAKVAGEWAKKYGPVFQVRMGNKVTILS
jgi:phenylacetate 2-hydroxylase